MCSILFLLGSADLKSGQEQKYIDAQLIFDWLTDIAKSLHHFIALAVKSIKDYFFNAYKSRHDLQSRVINSKFHILYSLKFFVISLWKSLRNEVKLFKHSFCEICAIKNGDDPLLVTFTSIKLKKTPKE